MSYINGLYVSISDSRVSKVPMTGMIIDSDLSHYNVALDGKFKTTVQVVEVPHEYITPISNVLLLNSTVMPEASGTYISKPISSQEFHDFIDIAYRKNLLRSFIGYDTTAKALEDLTHVPIPVNRDMTTANHGDMILVAKLKYRLENPGHKKKQQDVELNDFEFRRVLYYEEK